VSPSARRALGRGIYLEKKDRLPTRDAKGRAQRFFRFVTTVGLRRHYLNVTWHSEPGAWQAALRWRNRLEQGVL